MGTLTERILRMRFSRRKQKNIYIVEHWIPFSSSEDEGVQIVFAKDKEDCTRLIVADAEYLLEVHGDYAKQKFANYKEAITTCVLRAKEFPLACDVEARIEYEFRT